MEVLRMVEFTAEIRCVESGVDQISSLLDRLTRLTRLQVDIVFATEDIVFATEEYSSVSVDLERLHQMSKVVVALAPGWKCTVVVVPARCWASIYDPKARLVFVR